MASGTRRRAIVDGQPVPADLTPAQVTALFPRGVMGLRKLVLDAAAPDEDDYVFPSDNGSLSLSPGAHYTMAPVQFAVSGSALSPPASTRDVRATWPSVSPRRTVACALNGSVQLASWGGDTVAFTPPSGDEHAHERRGEARHHSFESQHRLPLVPSTAVESPNARGASEERAFPSHFFQDVQQVDEEAANRLASYGSVPSSVSEIMEDGPSVGHLMTDLHMDSTNASAANNIRARSDDSRASGCDRVHNDDGDSSAARDRQAHEIERDMRLTENRYRELQQALDMCTAPQVGVSPPFQRPGKLIQDRVHEHILLPMLAIDIIDTPEFQRLRNLKQLGTTVYLYPGATHTRFEHCIGVAHLASQMVRTIASKQPELHISDADILCVTIAGLCHDVGHGPFSHLFEQVINRVRREHATSPCDATAPAHGDKNAFPAAGAPGDADLRTPHRRHRASRSVPRYDRTLRREGRSGGGGGALNSQVCTPLGASGGSSHTWHHESMSIQLLRTILGRMDLAAYGLNEADARFIELCILGLPPSKPWPDNLGRPPHKRFLVDIVANKRHGIDVDKLDYFLRDSLGVYGKAAADVHFPRLLSACRVLPFEGQYQICYEEKLALNLGDIFAVRAKLHKHAYQHRIVKVTDYMVSDALTAADPYFLITGSNGQRLRISECVDDETAFCHLGDWVLNAIAASSEPELAPARHIISRLTRRDLYQIVGQATFNVVRLAMTEDYILDELVTLTLSVLRRNGKCTDLGEEACAARLHDDIIVSFTSITYGSSDSEGVPDDPINNVTFYNPKNPNGQAFKLPGNRLSPLFSPSAYQERSMMVLVRDSEYADEVAQACRAWKSKRQALLSVAVPNSNARGSPLKRPRDVRSGQPSESPHRPRRLEVGGANVADAGDYRGPSRTAAPTASLSSLVHRPPVALSGARGEDLVRSQDSNRREQREVDQSGARDGENHAVLSQERGSHRTGDERAVPRMTARAKSSRTLNDLIPSPQYLLSSQPTTHHNSQNSTGKLSDRQSPPSTVPSAVLVTRPRTAVAPQSRQDRPGGGGGSGASVQTASCGGVMASRLYARGVPPMLHSVRAAAVPPPPRGLQQ